MKISKEYLKEIIKEEVANLQKSQLLQAWGQQELEKTAADLRVQYALLQNLKKDYAEAPEKSSQIEKQKYNEIVAPHMINVDSLSDQIDQIMKKADTIQDPQQLRDFLINTYRPFFTKTFRSTIKQTDPTLKKFWLETKEAGAMPSKPYIKLLIDKVDSEVKYLQKVMQELDKYNTQ